MIYVQIPLGGSGREAIIDASDWALVSKIRWHYAKGYALGRCGPTGRPSGMHRLVAGFPPGMDVDHINGNKLDNRRANLRTCSRSENLQGRRVSRRNVSGFKGVSWHKTGYRAQIHLPGFPAACHIGMFGTAIEAAWAYDAAARDAFGEFARLNFPFPGEQWALSP